jgi:hypothetical protein
MKNIFLFLFVNALLPLVIAQTNIYHPFRESNAEWREINAENESTFEPIYAWDNHYWLDGDTNINGLNYHKLYIESTWDEETWSPSLINSIYYGPQLQYALREDSLRRVYLFDFNSGLDTLLYDFGNLNIGSLLPISFVNTDSFAFVSAIDSILIDSTYRKRYQISDTLCMFPLNSVYLIEGIGATTGLLNKIICESEEINILTCYKEEHELLFVQYFTMFHYCHVMVSENDISSVYYALKIFPNPAQTTATIKIENSKLTYKNYVLKIFNNLGKQVGIEESSEMDKQEINIDLLNLSGGLYFCMLLNENNKLIGSGKFIVE